MPKDKVMGAMFAVWNDLVNEDYSQQDVHGLIERSFPVVAQKTWRAKAPALPYTGFNNALDKIGMGPALGTVKDTTPAAGASDLASGKPVAASSTKAGHPASSLTDGEQNTRWESADGTAASLTIDLGGEGGWRKCRMGRKRTRRLRRGNFQGRLVLGPHHYA